MSTEQNLSGRERAIETHLDLAPDGAFSRVNKVLNEIIPQAFASRPNFIPKSALIDQAHSLGEYEINSKEKYVNNFNLNFANPTTENIPFSEEEIQRILNHHDKIVKTKSKRMKDNLPFRLVSYLQQVFGSDLARNVFDHPAFECDIDDDEAKDDCLLEKIIGDLCRDTREKSKDFVLRGLLLSALSILTSFDADNDEMCDLFKGKSESSTRLERHEDPNDIPLLQVGSVMSLLKPERSTGPFSIDENIIIYLGKAASVYEERIEFHKAMLLKKTEQKETSDFNDNDVIKEKFKDDEVLSLTRTTTEINEHLETDVNQNVFGSVEGQHEVDQSEEIIEIEEGDGFLGSSTLEPSIFEQIINAVTDGIDRSVSRLDTDHIGVNSSDSESSDDIGRNAHLDRYARHGSTLDEEPDDESSSSSSDDDEPDDIEASPELLDDEDDDTFNEGFREFRNLDRRSNSILRQALALSQNNDADPLKDIVSLIETTKNLEPLENLVNDAPPNRIEDEQQFGQDGHHQMPDLPQPPDTYPYCPFETVSDLDRKNDSESTVHPCLDPTCLNRFGSIPASFALVRILKKTVEMISQLSQRWDSDSSSFDKRSFKFEYIQGGMGSELFKPKSHLSKEPPSSKSLEPSGSPAIIQLLVSSVVLSFDRRREAINGLREAVMAEQKNLQGDKSDENIDVFVNEMDGTPLSDDEDDVPQERRNVPSFTRTFPSHSECLESKGMTRTAAAAGWDAALRMKAMKKITSSWKNRVQLYSYCTSLSLKCFRNFLQCQCLNMLDGLKLNNETNLTLLEKLRTFIPLELISKLDSVFRVLLSVNHYCTYSTLVSGDNPNEVDDLFMPLELFKDALILWGDFAPLIHYTTTKREQLLMNLVNQCFANDELVQYFGSFQSLKAFPNTKEECQVYMLDVLCRRFCVVDLINCFVSSPLHSGSIGEVNDENDLLNAKRRSSNFSYSFIWLLISSSLKINNDSNLGYLRHLTLAILHRFNTRVIMWNSLHLSLLHDGDEASISPDSAIGVEPLRIRMKPISALQFDPTKCSDSISIVASNINNTSSVTGSSANQRASKVWGSVLSSTFYNPRSGIHRWAIKLDKCERGHVFIGVATTQASTRTYIGGDKYGWGVIGTQALWHDRRKIRGDYGAPFRTGSIIVVTLDTDAGTVSFSLWKEATLESSPIHSPCNRLLFGGSLEDWGIAFESLPLDAKFYPAVGLYQRDDMVTLLGIESEGQLLGIENPTDRALASGACYYPRPCISLSRRSDSSSSEVSFIQNHNSGLISVLIELIENMLRIFTEQLISNECDTRNQFVLTVLTSVAAAISLFPSSIPVLSSRFALHALPALTDRIKSLEATIRHTDSFFSGLIREGKWVIRATGTVSGNHDFEEYVVDFSNRIDKNGEMLGFSGNGVGTTGKSKNGIVSIVGSINGSSLHFIEDWMDAVTEEDSVAMEDESHSSCVVSARLSLDSSKFEGSYRNVQFGTVGHIAGYFISKPNQMEEIGEIKYRVVHLAGIMRLAHCHLCTILGTVSVHDHLVISEDPKRAEKSENLFRILSDVPFRKGLLTLENKRLEGALTGLQNFYCYRGKEIHLLLQENFPTSNLCSTAANSASLLIQIEDLDSEMTTRNGGLGSFMRFCPNIYSEARHAVILTIIHFCNFQESLSLRDYDVLDEVWQSALVVLESQIRATLSNRTRKGDRLSSAELCQLRCQEILELSNFLMSLSPDCKSTFIVDDILKIISLLFTTVEGAEDIEILDRVILAFERQACLRLLSLKQIEETIPRYTSMKKNSKLSLIEFTVVGIPSLFGSSKQASMDDKHFLGTSYAGSGLINNAQQEVCRIMLMLEMFLQHDCFAKHHSDCDSLLLSILPFVASSNNCLQSIEKQSDIMSSLRNIFSTFGPSLVSSLTGDFQSDTDSRLNALKAIVHRDIGRVVLQTAVSVCHLLTYRLNQGDKQTSPIVNSAHLLEGCVLLLLDELKRNASLIRDKREKSLHHYFHSIGDDLFQDLMNISLKRESNLEKRKNIRTSSKISCSGLSYLNENGPLPSAFTSQSNKGSNTFSLDNQSSFLPESQYLNQLVSLRGYLHDNFSRLLNYMHCMTKSKSVMMLSGSVDRIIDISLKEIGLEVYRNERGNILEITYNFDACRIHGVYRARILRFLPYFLLHTESNDCIVEGLFELIGRANELESSPMDKEETLVEIEAVSCLRHLYASRFFKAENWRMSINKRIKECTKDVDLDSSSYVIIGVLVFLSGSPRALCIGSYVLLKPAAAVPLSPERQTPPNNKSSSSSSIGMNCGVVSHHVVGTGTEGIISGICRLDAPGGIITSIDYKAGTCEVLLLERKSNENEQKISRGALTTRVLRSSLSEIAMAELVPLVINPDFPALDILSSFLPKVLSYLLSPHDHTSEATINVLQNRNMTMKTSILAIRASTVLLSDSRLLHQFVANCKSQTILSDVLSVAARDFSLKKDSEVSKTNHLSSLPLHEGRFIQLLQIFAGIQVQTTIHGMTIQECWSRHSKSVTNVVHHSTLESSELGVSVQKLCESQIVIPLSSDLGPSNTSDELFSTNTMSQESTSARQPTSQSSVSSHSTEVAEEENETTVSAASHLREVAIAQMLELGLPRSWSELALRRTGGTNIEAAVHFCLERGAEMERLVIEERERERLMHRSGSNSGSSRRRSVRSDRSSHLLRQLVEMGFPDRWCSEALAATQNNFDEALTWILTNGERLSAEDEGIDQNEGDFDEDEDDEEDDDDEMNNEPIISEISSSRIEGEGSSESCRSENDAGSSLTKTENQPCKFADFSGWFGSVLPVRFISGRAIINPKTLSISGLPSGGFSSVGTKGILLTTGKWYYEAILETAGCLQIGWADGSFSGHCNADRGDGCGDGPSSWAFDGWRRYRWHASATEWGCRWKEGDVIGCLVDLENKIVSFTLNGKGEEIGMGVAFSGHGFRPCGGVYACVSFNRKEKLRLILGGEGTEPFKFKPPDGYLGVGVAIMESVKERHLLVEKEAVLSSEPLSNNEENGKRCLCDFSDGEHGHELFAWQHRYYGSDASVHLGANRTSKLNGSTKSVLPGTSMPDLSSFTCALRLIEKKWSSTLDSNSLLPSTIDFSFMEKSISKCILFVANDTTRIVHEEGFEVCLLYLRKLIFHILVTSGNNFELSFFGAKENFETIRNFWHLIESFVSLRSAGWVGEAGAMAIAAEALGLGISSSEHLSKVSQNNRQGITCMNIGEQLLSIPIAGLSQFLSSIQIVEGMRDGAVETYMTLAASAEACLGSEGSSGSLVFIQQGLQNAMCQSEVLVTLVVAAIRRSVRLLAVVDFSGDDSLQYDSLHDEENSFGTMPSKGADDDPKKETMNSHQADARLACFLTGIVLSNPVLSCLRNKQKVFEGLLEAWNVGLLSGSVPWRMVSALTAAGIINKNPCCFSSVGKSSKLVKNFYSRLQSIVVRRIWAERAAFPICSKYVQALLELLTSVRIADPVRLTVSWGNIDVDAATPLPMNTYQLNQNDIPLSSSNWEWDEGWVANDTSWEVWVGKAQFTPSEWKAPARSAVRSLMDGGEGPPMLGEGCVVMRGVDWPEECDDDGKSEYEREKADREKEKKDIEEKACNDPAIYELESIDVSSEDLKDLSKTESTQCQSSMVESNDATENTRKKRRKKSTNPRLPIGTVISIESWNGIPAMARRVRWHLTEKESVYRYGGDGGRYDLCHVEVNDKGTRIRKRHPLPESMEQCAARHGFGSIKKYSVLLRLRRDGRMEMNDSNHNVWRHNGLLEWPDFGAGISVDCFLYEDGSVLLREGDLIFGSKDSGWEARFGQPSYRAGTEIILAPSNSPFRDDIESCSCDTSFYQEISGTRFYVAEALRNKSDGSKIDVKFEMSMIRGHRPHMTSKSKSQLSCFPQPPPPICFDRDFHASSMSLSRDCRTLTCTSPDGRGTAFANVGFTKGVHYWEVKLEQADIGSVFVGVAEKPNASQTAGASSLNHDSTPRLNRWLGWGFVNFRATYAAGAERVYGAHCHNDDTVGVLLDCDAGRVSFFYDGMKFGEHILNDLGCAFENISPFGFNADGCGSGGLGQGSPSGSEVGRGGRLPAHGIVRPRALWPVIGLRNPGDRVTFSTKWLTSGGIEPSSVMRNILAVDEVLEKYFIEKDAPPSQSPILFPDWFISEAFNEYRRWYSRRWFAATTRGSGPYRLATLGLDVELDCSPLACAVACAAIGLPQVLLPGDRVIVKRSAGRPLELVEEAEVLGAYQSRLFYKLVSQKSEGGSLTSGGGRAWFWDESEVVGDSIQIIGEGKGRGIELPRINRFKCLSNGGIKIVYEGGAVVRSDLEIFDRSSNLGTVPCNTVISRKNVLERRVNSCGVTRYRICFEGIGEGWISSRIRGGKEEPIIELVSHVDRIEDCEKDAYFRTPEDAAMCWFQKFNIYGANEEDSFLDSLDIKDVNMFQELVKSGVISEMGNLESDSIVAALLSSISNFLHDGDALNSSFKTVALAVTYALTAAKGEKVSGTPPLSKGAIEAAATVLSSTAGRFSSEKALMARISVIRALNRRLRRALPWISVRPTQEGTSIFGGLCGQGASVERVGKRQLSDSMKLWVEVPCMASRMRLTKGLCLNNVKLGFLESVIHATETPTPLSHDEYELPREIRTVRVNRVKSRKVMSGSDASLKRKHSVFAQLQNEMRTWGGAALRRGFVAKGHGGQKRAFKVKLIGEGVNDYSGPYREVFTDAISEIMEFDSHGRGYLGVLDPTPNHVNDIGEGRELFMFSRVENNINKSVAALIKVSPEECRIHKGFTSLTLQRDETSREIEESVMFLGRLVGTACRHGIPVDLSLPFGIVWSALVEENLTDKARLEEIDSIASKIHNDYNGSALLQWEQRMANAFVDGISHVLPLELLPLLSKHELQDLFCGNPDVDVDLLKCVVEYEGYNENDSVILFFWEVLREMTNLDRKKFLQFVWARNRLPSKESDFESPFRIQKDIGSSDNSLPSASTCFFTLTLPNYSSKDVLREKLIFAMENVCTMESDYVTNDAEVGEGWRGI